MTERVGLVTCTKFPLLTEDDQPLLGLLREAGVGAEPLVWNDLAVRWGEFDLCIIRSTWDYFRHFPEFSDWVDRMESQTGLWNPAPIVRWNARKSYLRDLQSRGIPIVPTEWLTGAEQIGRTLRRRGWEKGVVKPEVSAAAENTFVVRSSDAVHPNVPSPTGILMLQPYVDEVESSGERSLIFLDGSYSHCVHRKAALNPQATIADGTPVPPSSAERAAAEAVCRSVDADLMYARVDLVTTSDGVPRLMELEVIEPSLYLGKSPLAAGRLATAILRRLSQG
ncbi:MAG: hypothetical protein L3K17_02365 [Thermoplasmata archaeon]|nr:hypothetical protein [Thermoplasmata archaeon]